MVTILMALDTELERARAQAGAVEKLAASTGELTVSLLHVFGDNPEGGTVSQVQTVRKVQDRLETRGVEVELLEASGNPDDEIIAAADEHDVDQICVGGRKRSPAGKALFGSVTQNVILGTDRPVLVCGGDVER